MLAGRACCSGYRCCSIDCASCAWRYSRSVARRILAYEPRSLHAMTIGLSVSGPLEFFHERKSLHNLFGYRRRQSRRWRSTGLWGWWNGIGLHGLIELGSITATEFVSTLRHHGDVHLRPIAIEAVRTEVYRAAQSVSLSQRDAVGRYQPVKIAIEPVIVAVSAVPIFGSRMIPPMPMIV
jgi:hypothetical protein